MGTVLGAFLTRGGFPIDMIDAYPAHVQAMKDNGAHIVGTEEFTVPVNALLPEEVSGIYDLVFLMTKQTANATVLTSFQPHLGPDSVVCTLQNGVPEPLVAEYVGKERTVGGTLLWGATFVEPGVSRLTTSLQPKRDAGRPFFDIGEIDGQITPRIKEVAAVLEHMGKADIVTNLMDARWSKLIINCAGSGMSASLGCRFGDFLDTPRAMECLSYLAYEASMVGYAAGYRVRHSYYRLTMDPPAYARMYYGLHDKDRDGKASMLQDLEKGRLTEVDMLNGYAAKVGDEVGIDTPYNDAVVRIVHAMEKGELPLSMTNLQYFPDIHYEKIEVPEE